MIMVISLRKANKQVYRKICNFTVNRDHNDKKQGNKGGIPVDR